MLPRPRWRSCRTAARTACTLVALALAAAVAQPAAAASSDQPGGTSAVLDSRALDQLQQRAAEVQSGLQAQQAEVTAAREELAAAEQAVAEAEAVAADAEDELAVHRAVVASYAAAVYRDGGALTPLTLLLSGGNSGAVVSAMGFLHVVDAHAAQVIGVAEESRRAALDQQEQAAVALAKARERADAVAGRVAELEAAAAAVTDELDAALGTVDRQLAQLQQEQQDVNERTAANWRAYVEQLSAAGVTAPPASALLDPPAGLPTGLLPVGASRGGAQRGAAQLPRQPASLLVLPAETLTAVTAAMDALGLPYAPGTAGPESWDCGSLVQSVYGAAGVSLPGNQADLLALTTPVDRGDVLPGDLVFLGTGESGLGHVGIALDPTTLLAADAGRCGRRPDAAGGPGARHRPPEPGPAGAGRRARADRRGAPRGVRQHHLPAQLRRRAGMGWVSERAHPTERHVPTRRGRPHAPLRRGSGVPGDVRSLCRRVRDADLHHRLLSHLRRPGAALRAEAGTGRRPGDQQPRLGPGRGPLRRDRAVRHAAVRLDEGQRRPLRIPAPRLGRAGKRARGAVALGVRRLLNALSRSARGIVGGRSYRADDSRRREPC